MKHTSWLPAARTTARLSQSDLAARVPCHQATVSLHESGHLTATPEFERALVKGLAQGPAVAYVDSDDLKRLPAELLAEIAACDQALKVIGAAVGRGEGDRDTLLALAEGVAARMRIISRAVDLRHGARGEFMTMARRPRAGGRPAASPVPQMRTATWVAARLGGVSRVWVHKLHAEGRLTGFIIGRKPGDERGGRLLFRAARPAAPRGLRSPSTAAGLRGGCRCHSTSARPHGVVMAWCPTADQLDRYSHASKVALPCGPLGVVILKVISGPRTGTISTLVRMVPAPE